MKPLRSTRMFFCLAVALLAPSVTFGQTETADTAVNRPGLGTVVSALDRVRTESHELEGLGTLTFADIRIVRVDAVLGAEDLRLFDGAFARNRSAVDELRMSLATSDNQVVGNDDVAMSLRAYLNDTVGINDVVAVNVAGGSVTFFVDESAVENTVGRMLD